ncbi:MAG TPA: HPr family phosphocarrier protein [Gammaproteobacteria bacterium]|nr:HPr family phosphocarrier protein [Gammaproteobacteria bacterium]
MMRQTVMISNKLGLHARAAAKFVQLASSMASDIKVLRAGREVDGKSIMGMMMLAVGQGVAIEITANGPDEERALNELTRLVQARFGEEQ